MRALTRKAVSSLIIFAIVFLAWKLVLEPQMAGLAAGAGAGGGINVSAADTVTAQANIGALPVKGRAPKTGYSRQQFGQAWADVDRNGCDTRNDILKRDLTDETFKPNTRNCVVLTGTLNDPYTGKTIAFTKTKASAVQVDHLIPLSLAWQSGAQQWSAQTRTQFANDPDNLLAADGPTNGAKGDKSPAAWMPPNRAAWCGYSVRYVLVALQYGVSVSKADVAMLQRGLDMCQK